MSNQIAIEGCTYQVLCENGHSNIIDYNPEKIDWECPVCGAKAIWYNKIDYYYDDKGELQSTYISLKTKKLKYCKHCLNIIEQTFYKPENGGTYVTNKV